MDDRPFSHFSLALYKINKQEEYFTLLNDRVSNITGAQCTLFDDTLIFLSNMKRSLIELQRICDSLGVNVNFTCVCHGPNM